MENDYFISAIYCLRKPQDKRNLLKALFVIRKGIDDLSIKLQKLKILNESECIKNLIGCLKMENSSILDVTLSILGNCCIDVTFARNSMKLNILHYLDRVLDKHKKDSIVGRVFRIIGNLCDNTCSVLIILREPLLIDKIVKFLNMASQDNVNMEKVSDATMLMALRTIRKLLKKSTLEALIIKHQILGAVGAVLIKYCNNWELNNSNSNSIEEILKLLHLYSRYEHPHIIQSLKNTGNGNSLLCLGKLITLNPLRVMKIITNLNKYCALKSDLPVRDLWQKLLEKIKNNTDENNYMIYLRSMYKLVDHPGSREHIKLVDSISDLINVLKDFTVCTDFSMECCTIILAILSKCQYNDTLVMKQINSDVVNVLIDKLQWTGVSSTTMSTPNHVKKKRKAKPCNREDNKKLKLVLDYNFYKNCNDSIIPYEDRCTSPSELSEISSDGPYSPTNGTMMENLSDSDNYSPVCSDAEETDLMSVPSLDPECPTPSDDDDVINLNEKFKCRFMVEINTLLWCYARMKPPVMDLGNPKLLTTLINLELANDSTKPYQVIMFILRRPDYLIPLMQTNFIQMLYDLSLTKHDVKICNFCKHAHDLALIILNGLTKVAESGGGKGDIAHTLLRSTTQVKNKIVLAIPYIIRSKTIITKLLINCRGLDILLNLLENQSDMQKSSIKGLCVLAVQQLKIKNPIHMCNQPQKQIHDLDIDTYSIPETCSKMVTFKLDDGNAVSADRDFLSNKSDYFNRLLKGNFMESKQSEITLHNITTKSLKLLLILLSYNTASLGFINMDLETLLELLEITDRYLLVELNVFLSSCVEQLHMSHKTVPIIYQWSVESATNILRVETIAFALVGDILDVDRINMFNDLFSLGYNKQLRDDIQKLLVRFLR